MRTIIRHVVSVIFIGIAAGVQAAVVYQNNFNAGSPSLSGFGTYGTGTIQATGGQLVVGVSDIGGVTLNTSSIGGYSPTLSANSGTVTWAFNVSNQDGQFNNNFVIVLGANISDPYNFGFPAQGYVLMGGGFVGNRMILARFDHGVTSIDTSRYLVDVFDGLAPLPQMGTVRVTYEPLSDMWSLYMDRGLSYTDPTSASTFLGQAVDGTYTHSPLPYFSLGGQTDGTDYYDNLSISVVPEPSSLTLAFLGFLTICLSVKSRARQKQ